MPAPWGLTRATPPTGLHAGLPAQKTKGKKKNGWVWEHYTKRDASSAKKRPAPADSEEVFLQGYTP
eukprot:1020651-Pelagomonas_calceolata.AAC.1